MFSIYSNKGMFLEKIIENSINWVNENNLGWFCKQDVPIKINKVENNKIIGSLYKKSNVDFYGIYKSKFVCFEAKQTNKDKFYLYNLKENQFSFLENINLHNGISFLILMFVKHESIYFIDIELIKNTSKKSIDINWCNQFGIKLEILFPGKIDLINGIKNIVSNKNNQEN